MLRNTVGQTWYVLVATLALPLVVLSAGRPARPAGASSAGPLVVPIALRLLLATGAGCSSLSALSFADPERADMFIYGRYVEIVAPPLLAVWSPGSLDRPTSAGVGRPGGDRPRDRHAVVLRQTFSLRARRTAGTSPGCPPRRFSLTVSALVLAGIAAAFWAACAIAVARRRPSLVVPLLLVIVRTDNGERRAQPTALGRTARLRLGLDEPGFGPTATPRR